MIHFLRTAFTPLKDWLPCILYVVVIFVLVLWAAVAHAQLTPEQQKAYTQLTKLCHEIGCTVSVRDE